MRKPERTKQITTALLAFFLLIASACAGPASGKDAAADCLIKTDQGMVWTRLDQENETASVIRTEQLDSYKGKSYWNDQMVFPTEQSIVLVRQNGIKDGMSLVIQDRNFQEKPIEATPAGSVSCMTVDDGRIYLADCSGAESTISVYDEKAQLLDTVTIDLPDTEFFMITAMLPNVENGGLWLLCGSLASLEEGNAAGNFLIQTDENLQIENVLDLNVPAGSLFSMA